MKKYNIKNYVRYKEDVKACMPDDKPYDQYTRKELITKFLPLVENLARKFSTTQQASGVMSINDIIQEGSIGLVKAIDKLDWERLKNDDGGWKPEKVEYVRCLEGHHRDASEKVDCVSNLLGRSDEVYYTEIPKIDIYCNRCHKMVHIDQGDLGKRR